MARVLYKPLGLLISILGGLVAGALFKRVWVAVAQEDEPPKPIDARRGWSEVIAAGAMKGAVLGGVKAVADRAAATGFARLTGAWPGPSKS